MPEENFDRLNKFSLSAPIDLYREEHREYGY